MNGLEIVKHDNQHVSNTVIISRLSWQQNNRCTLRCDVVSWWSTCSHLC